MLTYAARRKSAFDKNRALTPEGKYQRLHGGAFAISGGHMTKRENALGWMRIAGYHDDKRAFTRLLIENRVSKKSADEAWQQGQRQKQAGMACACPSCKRPA